ncbi:anti sigma factor C-terminal domain-containing protein [Clostridium algidicarnis]|uniref:anti sigma factor C-terminal domain-containing protein n=1 Tax=Clostridium algidicarnis TaxID=37659 RepID=UPI003FD800AF
MKEDNVEFFPDDKQLKKAYKKSKRLSTIRTIIIVILVVIPLYIINVMISYKMGIKHYEELQKGIEIKNPNAYISNVNGFIGFMGGTCEYTVSKVIGRKNINLYNKNSSYGLGLKFNRFTIGSGKGGHRQGEWPDRIDSSGNLTMMVFHPDIEYKEYKDDIALLNKVSTDSLLEMTLSFDKKYKINEISDILPTTQISELLIDGYTKEKMEVYKKEALEYDGKVTYIRESDFIGFKSPERVNYYEVNQALDNYKKFLDNLQFDFKVSDYKNEFSSIYSTLKAKDQLEGDNVDIIGVVVYGSPEELQKLSTNPHIKASSVGIITKDIIFN